MANKLMHGIVKCKLMSVQKLNIQVNKSCKDNIARRYIWTEELMKYMK